MDWFLCDRVLYHEGVKQVKGLNQGRSALNRFQQLKLRKKMIMHVVRTRIFQNTNTKKTKKETLAPFYG